MQNKLQELTEKIYREGLEKGQAEANQLVTKAKDEAARIVANAKAEAERIIAAARKEAERKFVWGEGSDRVVVFEEKDRDAELADVRKACDWRGKKFDAGFGWIGGPAQYGGCLLYTSPSPRDRTRSRMPSSA